MPFHYLKLTQDSGIATLTLNRIDKRNAINDVFLRELVQVLDQLTNDTATRVLLIHGNGEHFCAGADIAWMRQMADVSYEQNYDDAQLLADVMYQLYIFPKPTIVLAHGATLGGGLGLVSACDIAFLQPECRLLDSVSCWRRLYF